MKTVFEWDPDNAALNLRKHGVPFALAVRVFGDPFVAISADRIAGGELHRRTIGMADAVAILVVARTFRAMDDAGEEIEVIRIISARRADRSERLRYEEDAGSL